MKTIWKGAISFGLVTIPVRVYGATEEKSLRFHQLHQPDSGRIRYKRVCSVDGEEVEYSEIVKGYEYEKDHYVTLTEEELDSLPVASAKAIEIERFVDADQIDPIFFQKSYYLVPEPTGLKAYQLLARPWWTTARSPSPRLPSATRSTWPPCACATTSSCWRRCSGPTRSVRRASRCSTRRCRSGRRRCGWPAA